MLGGSLATILHSSCLTSVDTEAVSYRTWYDIGVDDPMKRLRITFYRGRSGNEPVREWLQSLSREDRLEIGTDLKTVEFGWPIGMPVCRPLGDGLWEVRSNISSGRIARVLFCIDGGQMYLLSGFIKKTQKTPDSELSLARTRQKEVLS
ncbi:MAG: type II toxin-antitoxin system RelE/ParE family toxin [Thermomicrobiales bacterium]|nr:type II toxin-antitoxin system RelE/ParE family toxin [Thermomicrobiales bacterium]